MKDIFIPSRHERLVERRQQLAKSILIYAFMWHDNGEVIISMFRSIRETLWRSIDSKIQKDLLRLKKKDARFICCDDCTKIEECLFHQSPLEMGELEDRLVCNECSISVPLPGMHGHLACSKCVKNFVENYECFKTDVLKSKIPYCKLNGNVILLSDKEIEEF